MIEEIDKYDFVDALFYAYVSNYLKNISTTVNKKVVYRMELLFALMALASNPKTTKKNVHATIDRYGEIIKIDDETRKELYNTYLTFREMSKNNYLPRKKMPVVPKA